MPGLAPVIQKAKSCRSSCSVNCSNRNSSLGQLLLEKHYLYKLYTTVKTFLYRTMVHPIWHKGATALRGEKRLTQNAWSIIRLAVFMPSCGPRRGRLKHTGSCGIIHTAFHKRSSRQFGGNTRLGRMI